MFAGGQKVKGSSPGREKLNFKIKGGVSVRRAGPA